MKARLLFETEQLQEFSAAQGFHLLSPFSGCCGALNTRLFLWFTASSLFLTSGRDLINTIP